MNVAEEFYKNGFIEQSFELSDLSLIREIAKESSYFEQIKKDQIRRNIKHSVPYFITESISKIAHDTNLKKVIGAIFGLDTSWVMWGSNVRENTPNDAGQWHRDIESYFWPNIITLAIGLADCFEDNATYCIQGTHKIDLNPPLDIDFSDGHSLVDLAKENHVENASLKRIQNFGNGKFYVFNAKLWHCGKKATALGRKLLFMHFQKGSDHRIPYVKDYTQNLWFDYPAPYMILNLDRMDDSRVKKSIYPFPKSWLDIKT